MFTETDMSRDCPSESEFAHVSKVSHYSGNQNLRILILIVEDRNIT